MTYKNFPVYVGHGNRVFTSDWGYHKDHMIYANRVNVNFSAAGQANRRLGVDIDQGNQYVYNSDLKCDIDFDFYFCAYPKKDQAFAGPVGGGESIYGFLFDTNNYDDGNIIGSNSGANYFPIKVGGNFYNKCFLDNISIDVTPLQPVRCNVKFSCYQPPENLSTDYDDTVPFQSYDEWISGNDIINSHNCELSGFYGDIVYSDVINRLSYSKNYTRTPVYTLGSSKPTKFFMDSIEAQMDVESSCLANISNFSGTKLENDVGFKILDSEGDGILDSNDGGYDIIVGSGSRVNLQNYNINEGDVILAKASVREVLL
jgi:hypothetical protein